MAIKWYLSHQDTNWERTSIEEEAQLTEIDLSADPGFHVLAIRRGTHYLYNPRKYVVLHADDQVIANGPEEGEHRLVALFGFELVDDEDTGTSELVPLDP